MREKRIIWKSTNKGYIRIASDSLGRSALAKIIRKVKIDTNWLEQGEKESRQVGRGSRAGEARSYQILDRWLDGSKSYRSTLQMEAKTPNKRLGLSHEFIKYRKRGD